MSVTTLNRSTTNHIEFDLTVDGASMEEAKVFFVIHAEGYDISFLCSRSTSSTFTAKIPPVPFLPKGATECSVDVVINGQFFTPLHDDIIIVDDVKVAAKVAGSSKEEHKEGEEDEEVAKKNSTAHDIDTNIPLITLIQNQDVADESVRRTGKVLKETKKSGTKDSKVYEILESMNIRPAEKQPRKRGGSLKSLADKIKGR